MRRGLAEASAEALRNRQLRQIDWRFFLAEPAPARSVCWAGATLADSLRRVSTEVAREILAAWFATESDESEAANIAKLEEATGR